VVLPSPGKVEELGLVVFQDEQQEGHRCVFCAHS
jgi:hypothetical protein